MKATRKKLRADKRQAHRGIRRAFAHCVRAVTAVAFFFSLGAPYAARAQANSDEEPVQLEATEASSDSPAASREASEFQSGGAVSDTTADENATPASAADDSTRPRTVQALPDGPAKSAVTPQAISLPKAEGSIQGMGESFTPNLSAGTGTFSVPIALPPGRAGVQPSLALSYGTSAGNGPLGVGWSLAVPFIARQTDRGLPRYVDGAAYQVEEDRFIYNGGQELVPVDNAAAAAIDGGQIPTELSGFQQYRARVEGAFMRFFRSPDGRRWVVQDKAGMRFDFGVLPSGAGPAEMVGTSGSSLVSENDGGAGRIFTWYLTRMSDAHGSAVYFQYFEDSGQRYLQDIYYVSPASCAASNPEAQRSCTAALAGYGRRVHLSYEDRADVYDSYISTWRIANAKRLTTIDISAYDSIAGQRTMVRRYHLRYDPSSFVSLLSEVQVEGRPDALDSTTGAFVGNRSVPESSASSMAGRLLPPMRFQYSSPAKVTTGTIPGFGGLDGTVHVSASSPTVSVNDDRADLFDVNSDGLPDVIVTDPAHYRSADGGPAVGVFFNGFNGANATPGVAGAFSDPVPMAIPSGYSSALNLGNLNVNPMDADGDGRSDLLYMPRVANYGYFTPTRGPDVGVSEVSPSAQGWGFSLKSVVLPRGDLDPRIDFGRDGARIKLLDVNHDHLIDVVRTTGTEMQTFLNLGWVPGGDGRFGSATFDGSSWRLSTAPISSCVLELGMPLDFSDPEVRLADMNGDGIQDIVKIRKGRVAYWPGRGPGLWGVGAASCGTNEGDGREVEMSDPPQEVNAELADVFTDDVNMDGTADVVQVRYNAIDVWFNQAGQGFTARVVINNSPFDPGFARRIRFADIDGSGTTDIVYGNGGNYQFVDPMSGRRPRLLTRIENGLGGLTTLEYGSSAEDYLRDLTAAGSCMDSSCERFTWSHVPEACDAKLDVCAFRSGGSPVVSNVVRSVQTTDQLASLGQPNFVKRTEYRYHDAYYEGLEFEFRGFGAADAVEVGDSAEPTSITRTFFDQGRRPGDSDRIADNPNEALKGRSYLTEVFDESGAYLSTSHATLAVRKLLTGLDGRAVSYAYVSRADELRYDDGPFMPGSGQALVLDAVVREQAGAGVTAVTRDSPDPRTVILRSDSYAQTVTTIDSVDNAGNMRTQTNAGRMRGEFGEPLPNETIVQTAVPTLCNPEQWIWRTAETAVSGQGDPTLLGHTVHSYATGSCDLLHSTTDARLPRDGSGAAIAFEFSGTSPAEALTQSDEVLESSSLYDSWGNVAQVCAGGNLGTEGDTRCLRLSSLSYDQPFFQFPTSERIATNQHGAASLATTALWDEGLGLVTTVTDPNALATGITYDGLGRLTSLTPPHVANCGGTAPLTRIAYELVPNGQPINRITTTTELDCAFESARELMSMSLVDGLGRKRATLLQAESADVPALFSRYQRSGIVRFDARGSVVEAFQPDFIDSSLADDMGAALAAPASTIPSTFTFYDTFGRPTSSVAEDGSSTRTVYHALSTDVWDANDLDASGSDYGTFTTEREDGHGRVIDQVLRNRHYGASDIEYYRLWTDYRADGKAVQVTRAETHTDAPRSLASIVDRTGPMRQLSRQLTYDTAGRRIASTDPDTDSRSSSRTAANRTWRYLFNRTGDLAAVRDPRGCGQNFYYDHAGRLVAEHYVSCAEAQPNPEVAIENVPAGTIGVDFSGAGPGLTADARYYFDAYPSWFTTPAEGFGGVASLPSGHSGVLGRSTSVMDRGERSAFAYDDRGNVIWTARELAVVPQAGSVATTLAPPLAVVTNDAQAAGYVAYDTAHVYTRIESFDHAGRPSTLAIAPFDGNQRTVSGQLLYNQRSLPYLANVTVAFGGNSPASYTRSVVDRIDYTRDGLVSRVQYGQDQSGRPPTVSETFYDVRRRPERMQVTRTPSAPTTSDPDPQKARPLNAVSTVVDQTLIWDKANNLVEVSDSRPGEEWPAGFRPASYRVGHDALYRVADVELDYSRDDGSRTPDDTFVDYRTELGQVVNADPMHTKPAPLLPAPPAGRPASLTYDYDWLANMVESTDDAYQFYERSLGAITNGFDEPGDRPSALRLATDLEHRPPNSSFVPAGGRGGYLEVAYGEGGNAVMLTVHAQCTDTNYAGGQICYDPKQGVSARLQFLAANCTCAAEQHYQYRWDELNRLVEARRYDRSGGTGSYTLAARQRYRYDAGNQRATKQTIAIATGSALPESIAAYVFAGDLERRGLVHGGTPTSPQYVAPAVNLGRSEDQYLIGGARLVWKSNAQPVAGAALDPDLRVGVALADVLGTSSGVIDTVSGELMEASTYLPTGARESWRSPDAADVGAEPEGFTGKEADEEVGLTYFGERYLIARLGRWATPDPLSVHALAGGEAVNSYHYVAGNLLQARDPIGLDPQDGTEGAGAPPPVLPRDEKLSPSDEAARRQGEQEAERQYRSEGFANWLNAHHLTPDRLSTDQIKKAEQNNQIKWDERSNRWVSTRVVVLQNNRYALEAFRDRYNVLAGTELAIETAGTLGVLYAYRAGDRLLVLTEQAAAQLGKERRAVEAAIRANEMLDQQISAMSKRERGKIAMMIGAYDSATGEVAVGRSGAVPKDVHPELQKRVTESGLRIGDRTLCANGVGNCAEFDAANQLLKRGANIDDIRFTAPTRPRTNFDPTIDATQKACAHCEKMGFDH